MGRLEGKIAIVTGGASGMGRASAIRLAEEGATVVIGDIDVAGAEKTATSIAGAGGVASVVGFDASDADSCVRLVERAVAEHGRLDVVANVAGISSFYHLHETTNEIWERFLAVNLTSVLVICREAMPHLRKSRGCVINFASINARMPVAYHAGYAASKAGVVALTKSIAQEFVAEGVRCNAICPGGFDTAMNVNIRMPEDIDRAMLAKLMNPRIPMADAERITGAVVFLASDDAAYVNGEEIVVDGGLTALL